MNSQEIFDIKQKFLREIPHPKLIFKQIKILNKDADEPDVSSKQETGGLFKFLNDYIGELMPLKLQVSKATTAKELENSLSELYKLQYQLIHELNKYYQSSTSTIDDREIKQSAPFNVYQYIKEIESNGISDNKIKDYLCYQFERAGSLEFSALAKGVLRARKIVNNGR